MEDDPLKLLEEKQSAFEAGQAAVASGGGQPWSAELVQFLTLSILAFSCVALVLATALLWRTKVPPLQVLRIFGIVSIISVSAVLLVTGYSNDQLTPIVGLFGAIAGYLLGRDSAGQAATPPAGGDRH